LLLGRVQGGGDGQATSEEEAPTVVLGRAIDRVVDDGLDHVVAEVGGDPRRLAALRLRRDVQHVRDRHRRRRVELLLGDDLLVPHERENGVTPDECVLRVPHGVPAPGGLGDPREHGGLLDVEVGGGLAEVVPRGHLDAVLRGPELRDVEVALEDLVLGHLLLECDGEFRLAQLAPEAHFRGRGDGRLVPAAQARLDEHVLDELLREGRATLVRALDEVQDRGAEHAFGVDAPVVVEPFVLDGDHRGAHVRRHRVQRDHDAVLGVERRQEAAVGGEHHRLLGRRVEGQLVRELVEDLDARLGGPAHSGHRRHDQAGGEDSRSAGQEHECQEEREELRRVHRARGPPGC